MKRVKELLAATEILNVRGNQETEIKSLTFDSRQVKTDCAFFALPGRHFDGRQFIQDAVERGAAMIVSDEIPPLPVPRTVLVKVADVRRAMAEMAACFHDYPARRLKVVGITGTNGKTTVAWMICRVLRSIGRKVGLLGTIQYEIGDRSIPAARTTPESLDVQAMLAQMVAAGCDTAVMEVSSHGLVQKRVWGIEYDAAVFTNLTQDHLDYHQTLDSYFDAKSLLFRNLRGKPEQTAVVNIDDPYGAQLAKLLKHDQAVRLLTYGITDAAAALRATVLEMDGRGSVFDAATPWGPASLRLRLLGRFNIYNSLAAAGVCGTLGAVLPDIAVALETLRGVPGRLEEIETGAGFQVFVDYAHTEDALQNVLNTLRELVKGRLILVFGCGGNRDRRKRPLMGAVAARLADYTVLTSDNPRKENPSEIIREIRAGMKGCENYEVVEDRYEAIARALSLAERGDIVLVAGKGHENYQEFAETVIPFDDRQVIRDCLNIRH